MAAYPTSPMWAYPVTRTLEFSTGIAAGDNGTEQRWPKTGGVESWGLPYSSLTLAQRDTLLASFDAAQGSYAGDLTLAFLGTTYTGLAFDADELLFTESSPGRWSGSVKLVQAVRPVDTGSLPTDFPTLTSGARVQFPYTHGRNWDTVVSRTEGGRFARAKRAATRRVWSVGGPSISTAEAQAIWDMFRLARGQWAAFGLTDPDSAVRYASCRFSADLLTWQYSGPDENSLTARIQTCV
jgi:hypothetical protein